MIRKRVSAVVRLCDSFLRKPVDGAGARCSLDGSPVKPIIKPGGILVWTDLLEGAHTLSISLPGFLTEDISVDIYKGRMWEGFANLKPGTGYPYRSKAVSATIALTSEGSPLKETAVWIAVMDESPLKLSQAKAEKGSVSLRVFYAKPASALPIPGAFIIDDARKPELVNIKALEDKDAYLAEPLSESHTRGRALLPAGQYRTDSEGRLSVLARKEGRMAVFCLDRLQYADLRPGKSQIDF